MQVSETVQIVGHIIDSNILSKVFDAILEADADYRIDRLDVGKTPDDQSTARLTITAADPEALERLMMRLQVHGVNAVDPGEALLRPCPADGVFPSDFYSTTNLVTSVRIGSEWVQADTAEMDCGLVVDGRQVRTIPVSDVRAGDMVVCGAAGVRVERPILLTQSYEEQSFEFMSSGVSSEKPQALTVARIAQRMREVKEAGQRILWVAGPAVVHTGAAPAMVALVNAGYVDCIFSGNALATHDIESALYGTSLGVDLSRGQGVEHGHEHHIRAINTIRSHGSIAGAVAAGTLTSGVMHAMVTNGKPYVLVGSVRDDGPLPDVYTDVIEGQRAMRAQLTNVGFAIMVASMLHSIATGNLLPASVPLVSVDINPATVTKLADRGSAQAVGVVTDIGLFLEQLAHTLVPGFGI